MSSPPSPPRPKPGLLESTVMKLFTRTGQVLDVEDVGSAFRIITLGGEALRKAEWTPGDKVQVLLGGWVQRTYTPIDWDPEAGRTRIAAYLHGEGPASQWARALRRGDACALFGPRKSLDLTRPAPSSILFGDETSFGLGAALLGAARAPDAHLLFEVSSLAGAQPALAQLELSRAHLVERASNDQHLTNLEEELLTKLKAEPEANLLLSGKASSIQRMVKLVKRSGLSTKRMQTKAYWAPGKTGLD